MNLQRISKQFYSRGSIHNGQSYSAATAAINGKNALAFMRVRKNREQLVFCADKEADEIILTDKTYILSPHFAGGYLYWVENIDGDWNMRAVNTKNPSKEDVFEPVKTNGRANSISSFSNGKTTLLVWEERLGRKTQIKIGFCKDGKVEKTINVTDDKFNAYDPACCIDGEGNIYVIYSAFVAGNYRIFIQPLSSKGEISASPAAVSNDIWACIHPSICPRTAGGIWFSFSALNQPEPALEKPYLQHDRFMKQSNFFRNIANVHAGIFEDGKTYSVLPDKPCSTNVSSTAVTTAVGSHYSRVFEDTNGRLHALIRKHCAIENISYETQDKPLDKNTRAPIEGPLFNHPALCCVTLLDGVWDEPQQLIGNTHFDGAFSATVERNNITVAFTEDARCNDWSEKGEWFDDQGQLGVGVLEFKLPETAKPGYKVRPYLNNVRYSPSMENPKIDKRENDTGLIYAFGQTHKHTDISICARRDDRDIDTNYRFMQDVQHCDFGATADHAYNMWHTEMLRVRKYAQYYYFPGEFVALPGYEWTGSGEPCMHEGGPWGHVNPLYFAEDGELDFYTPCDPGCAGGSLKRLWETYRGKKLLTPPHHTASKAHPYNWDIFDDEFVSVIELFQDYRGTSEQPAVAGITNQAQTKMEHWAIKALKDGKRFGFIAGGDHRGIALAGVKAKELTRNGIYEAMRQRNCFATSGESLRLSFDCNGEPMGSEVKTDLASFQLRVSAPENIQQVQIVRNGQDVEKIEVNACRLEHDWEAKKETNGEFWYCRIIFDNGELAWPSPIWLV